MKKFYPVFRIIRNGKLSHHKVNTFRSPSHAEAVKACRIKYTKMGFSNIEFVDAVEV